MAETINEVATRAIREWARAEYHDGEPAAQRRAREYLFAALPRGCFGSLAEFIDFLEADIDDLESEYRSNQSSSASARLLQRDSSRDSSHTTSS